MHIRQGIQGMMTEIWLNENLTIMEKLFLVEIDSLNGEKGCYASNKHFSKFFTLSKNRCSEIIKSLESKGLITINYEYEENKKVINGNEVNRGKYLSTLCGENTPRIKIKSLAKYNPPYAMN